MRKLLWQVSASVPFDWKWSKNRMWVARAGTYARRLADHARARRDSLVFVLRAALRGRRVANNVLWVNLRVEIPDHRGDAVNCLDLALDAIEIATGLNDRWYSIAGLDWAVVKDHQPQLTISIGQTEAEDVQVCGGRCGEILPLERFTKGRSKLGRATTCRECAAAMRVERKNLRAERKVSPATPEPGFDSSAGPNLSDP